MNLMLGNWDTKFVPLGCDERTVQERVGACGGVNSEGSRFALGGAK